MPHKPWRVGEDSSFHFSDCAPPGTIPFPGLVFSPSSAPQGQSRRACPTPTKGFSSHGHQQTTPGVKYLQHEEGGTLKSHMPTLTEAQGALPIRHLLIPAVREANRRNAQRSMWRNSSHHWRSQGHKPQQIASWGYAHEKNSMGQGQPLIERAVTRGFAKRVSPPLSLTSNMIQTRERPSRCIKVSSFQYFSNKIYRVLPNCSEVIIPS